MESENVIEEKVERRRFYYYRAKILNILREVKREAFDIDYIEIWARSLDFWCRDAGFHFDAMIRLYWDGYAEVFGTGYHCSWPAPMSVEGWEEAINWLARWCAKRPWTRWSFTYYVQEWGDTLADEEYEM